MDQFELSEKLKNFYKEELNFCGCGRPEDTMLFIRDLLNIMNNRREKYTYDEYNNKIREVFQFENKATEKELLTTIQEGIVQFILYTLDNVGVLEHGSGIKGAWLTEKGKQLVEWLNTVEDFESIMD